MAIIRQLPFVFGAICSDGFVNRSLLSWVWYIKNKKRKIARYLLFQKMPRTSSNITGSAPSATGILCAFCSQSLMYLSTSRKQYPLLLLLSKLVREFLRKYINSELMQGYHCQIHKATGITSVLNECSWWVLSRVGVLTTTCTAQCCDLMHKWPRQRRQSSGTGVFGIFFVLSPKGKLWMDLLTAAGQVSSTKAVVDLLMLRLPSMETPLESCFPGSQVSQGSPASMQMLWANTV